MSRRKLGSKRATKEAPSEAWRKLMFIERGMEDALYSIGEAVRDACSGLADDERDAERLAKEAPEPNAQIAAREIRRAARSLRKIAADFGVDVD